MSELPPATSHQIADAAALDERYVREWLASMVIGGVVTYHPTGKLYHLPAEHAASLTPQGALGNLAVYGVAVALIGQVQDRLIEVFETGGGLSYEDYPCFHSFMAEDSGQTVVPQLAENILPLAPGLIERLEQGIEVMDAGCGAGLALVRLAGLFPESRFTGYENVTFEQKDLTGYDATERFDLITSFDAIHDQKHPQELIQSLYQALKPGGLYLVQDIGGSATLENNLDFPMATLLYAISTSHCTPVSLGQGGEGLGTMWGWETCEEMLEKAGFVSVERHRLPHDPMNVWFVARKAG